MSLKIEALKELLQFYEDKGYEASMEANGLVQCLGADANKLGAILNKLLRDGIIIGKGFGTEEGAPGPTVGLSCNPDRTEQIRGMIEEE